MTIELLDIADRTLSKPLDWLLLANTMDRFGNTLAIGVDRQYEADMDPIIDRCCAWPEPL